MVFIAAPTKIQHKIGASCLANVHILPTKRWLHPIYVRGRRLQTVCSYIQAPCPGLKYSSVNPMPWTGHGQGKWKWVPVYTGLRWQAWPLPILNGVHLLVLAVHQLRFGVDRYGPRLARGGPPDPPHALLLHPVSDNAVAH
jgi:hypothetical protein